MLLVFLLTTFALNVSVFHLGRPAYAWRALRMWRRSWLSREVLLFGLFYASVSACTLCAWVPGLQGAVTPLAYTGILFGFCGTLASAAIYLVKARPAWNTLHTPLDFLISAALLGSSFAGTLATRPFFATLSIAQGLYLSPTLTQLQPKLVLGFAALWLLNQFARLARLRRASIFERRASYNLLRGEALGWRVALCWLSAAATVLFTFAPLPWLALFTATATVALGRYLFFVSVVPLSMGLTFLARRSEAIA
jgi:DMSO reductase anchor subunit